MAILGLKLGRVFVVGCVLSVFLRVVARWLRSRFLVWCVLALVPSWQGVARRRTRSERGKAEKVGAVATWQAVNRVKLWQPVKP